MRLARFLFRSFGLAAAAAPALAQSAPPSPTPPVRQEYVEVTATRVPEDPGDVPASITVVSGEDLRNSGALDLRQALSMVAGVDIAPGGDGGPAASVPEFWGLKEFDAFLLVVDGVPWGGAFNPALATLDLDDIDRVEVMRGAAPVMYGATSFVGVVHVVHRGAGEALRSLALRGGSFGSGGAVFATALPAWAGFRSTLDVDLGRQGFEDDRTEWKRGHALWRNARALGSGALRLDVDVNILDQAPASPQAREGTTLTSRTPLDANHNPEGAFLDERRFTIDAGYDRRLANADWSSTVSYAHTSRSALRGFLEDLQSPAGALGFRQDIEQNDVYVDSHLAWIRTPRLKLVAGVDHIHSEGESAAAIFDYDVALDGSNPPPASFGALDLHVGDRREFSGAYAFAEWNPAPAWRFEAGLRLNRTFESREGEEGAEDSGKDEADRERDDVRLGGSAGAVFTPWSKGADHVRVFASYKNTFKPAAFDFGVGEEGDGPDKDAALLKPETAASYEVGLKGRMAGGAVSFEVASFLMDFDNLVIAQSIGGLPALANAGKQRFKGIESSLAWRLKSHLTARATYAYHDARFRDFLTEFDGAPTQLAGNRLEMSPHHLASASVVWAPPRGVLALAQVNVVGSRFLDRRNTALADGYATLAAAIGYRGNRWELRVDGQNLSDERPPTSESELGDAQYYRLPSRRVDATLVVRF